jgi:eukaryotic-like serine/threonine-protein kinase
MLTPGGTLGGRYRLGDRIASGGMGDVWKAEDTVLGRVVAVKILQSALLQEPGFVERFRAEARVMATINHPGVVRVYDYGESGVAGGGQVAYLVMEYVEGEALSHTLSRVGRLTPDRTMNLLAQAGEALQAAHDHGIVHRDVKPGNLLVRPDGKLVLTDFGIARSAMSGQLTTAGSILGTASYVSPEQASGTGSITAASDVYSLGVVGYQCLSGHRPFEGENPIQVAMKHIQDVPQPLPADVPPMVRDVIDRAMAKDPAQRWPSASVMADAARRVSGTGPTTSTLAGPTGVMRPDRTAMLPTSGAPTSPGTGNYLRGAAPVPYGPTGMVPDEGYTTQAPPAKSRAPMVIGIVLAAVIVLAGVGGIGYALVSSGAKHGKTPGAISTSASHKPSKTRNPNAVNLNSLLGQPYTEAEAELEDKGINVRKGFQYRPGYEPGSVTNFRAPRNPARSGDTVILLVEPNNGRNNNGGGIPLPTLPGTGGDDGGGDNGGGDGGQSSAPPTDSPSPTPPDVSPTDSPPTMAPGRQDEDSTDGYDPFGAGSMTRLSTEAGK